MFQSFIYLPFAVSSIYRPFWGRVNPSIGLPPVTNQNCQYFFFLISSATGSHITVSCRRPSSWEITKLNGHLYWQSHRWVHFCPPAKAGSTLADENWVSVPLSWPPPNNLPSHCGLGFGCVAIRTGQHRIDYCWSCKTESQGKKEGWWWGNWRWWGEKLDFNEGEKSTKHTHTCKISVKGRLADVYLLKKRPTHSLQSNRQWWT